MKKYLCKKEGITLIALIITIIVMLILVGVTVNIAINGGLIGTAIKASSETKKATEKEELIAISLESLDGTGNFNKEKFKLAIALKTGYEFEETTGKITTPKGNIFYVDENGSIVETEPVIAWDGTIKTEVVESENNTYYISNAAELAWLASEVNSGNTFSGKTIQLTNDIDLGNQEWTPIGRVKSLSDMAAFEGTFEGAGHVISNIKITSSNECAKDLVLGGVFGAIQNATIENLGVEDGIIQGYGGDEFCSQIGGIVGASGGTSKISNCYNKNVKLSYERDSLFAGGIISYCQAAGNLTIENCYNATDFDNTTESSGIMGCVETGAVTNISNCYNIGSIMRKNTKIETGIYGYLKGEISVDNCYTIPFKEGTAVEVSGITILELEAMKGIASNLGAAFKADTNNINNGYPILTWE